jgi:hypothetical protein
MTPEKTKQLIDKYPDVFIQVSHLECGDGWFSLINTLSGIIEFEINQLPEEFKTQVYAVQIKEKFGSLRFYMSKSIPKIDGAISLAENLSRFICEECGNPGSITSINGWLCALCDTHKTIRIKKNTKYVSRA